MAALTLATAFPALAQDRDLLRGEVPESAINDELLRRQGISDQSTGSTTRAAAPAPGSSTADPSETSDDAAAGDNAQGTSEGEQSLFPVEPKESPEAFDEAPPAGHGPATSASQQRSKAAKNRIVPTKLKPAKKDAGKELSEPSERSRKTSQDDTTPKGIKPVGTVDSETDLTVDQRAQRAQPIEGLERPEDETPYAPLGLRLGSFNIYSTLEQGMRWTSNINSSPKAQSALQSETTLRMRAESDWSRHSATMEAYGVLREALDGPNIDDNEAGFNGELRLDITDEFRALASLNYQMRPEDASSPVIIEDAVSRPLRQTLAGSAGLERDVGKLRFGVSGELVDNRYGDADLANGMTLSQKDRDSLLATATLRAGFEISPSLTPFVAIEMGRREYELEVDAAGYRRSSDRTAARLGMQIDTGEKLRGEIAIGWLREKTDDPRLDEISTPTIDATVNWSPQRGTDVTLLGTTSIETTNASDQSGSVLYSGGVRIDRQIRANLTGNVLLGAAWRDYVGTNGHDLTLSAEAGFTWWMNRNVGISGRARHEQVESNLPGRDTKTDSVFLGVKLQR